MKIYAFLNKQQVRPEDIRRLEKARATIYFSKNIADCKELFSDLEDKVLLLQWTGLKTKGFAPTSLITSIPNLKAVCISMTAYTWIDGATLRKKGIDLCNCPGKSSDSVATYYFLMASGLLRNIPLAFQNERENIQPGRDIEGLRAGIVGLGSIGLRFAQIAKQNIMDVVYWDREKKNTPYKRCSLDSLFTQSDVVFISLAGNSETEKILTRNHIDLMKKDAVLVNCAQDNLIDRPYVIKKVQKGLLGGFAYETEDSITKKSHGNIWIMPEIAYYTKNTLANESRIMTNTCISYTNSKPINVVNK